MSQANEKNQNDLQAMVRHAALRVSRSGLQRFGRTMKQRLRELGVPKEVVGEALKAAFDEFSRPGVLRRECAAAVDEALHMFRSSGVVVLDVIGRFLVEYCFIRAAPRRMLHPDGSDEDESARAAFVAGVLPRPLMRYFLISVRGTIEGLEPFEAKSVLFGEGNELYEKCLGALGGLLPEYTDGEGRVQWLDLYEDRRARMVSLRFIAAVLERLKTLDAERYVRILDNIARQDPERDGANHMQRHFVPEDVAQLLAALERGMRMLTKQAHGGESGPESGPESGDLPEVPDGGEVDGEDLPDLDDLVAEG